MGELKKDKLDAGKLWNKITAYETGVYPSWFIDCQSNSLFYHGEQWTDEERDRLKERGQYELVINKIHKAMRGIAGLISSNLPKYNIVSSGESHEYKTTLANKLIDWAWNNSGGVNTLRKAVKRAIVDNISYLFVYVSRDLKVKFDVLNYGDVVVDPSSKDPLFDDAEMICVRRYLSVGLVKQLYGITDEFSSWQFNTTGYKDIIDTRDATYNEKAALLSKVFSADRQYVKIYECYCKQFYRASDGEVKPRIIKKTLIGFEHVYEEVLPDFITHYPIIPMYSEDTENPYKRGEVHYIKDLQRFINKAYGVVLMNAQTMSMPRIFMEETAVPDGDLEKYEEISPNGIYLTTAGSKDPTIVQGQPINNAFFTLYSDAVRAFEDSTLPANMLSQMNTSSQSNDLLQIRENILDSFKDLLGNVDAAVSRLGLVVLQYCQSFLGKKKIVRIIDAEKKVLSFEKLMEANLDVDDDNSVQAFIHAKTQEQVPEEEIEAMIAKAKEDTDFAKSLTYFVESLDFSSYDVSVIPQSTTPTFQMAMMKLMLELAQSGAVDSSEVLQYAPVENKKALIEKYDIVNQLKAQMQDLIEENMNMKGVMQSLQKSIVQAEMDKQTLKSESALKKIEADTRYKARFDLKSNKLDHREKMMELEATIERLQNKIDELMAENPEAAKQTLEEIFAVNNEGE